MEIFILGAKIIPIYLCFLSRDRGENNLLNERNNREQNLNLLLLQIRFLGYLINYSDERQKLIKLNGYMHSEIHNAIMEHDNNVHQKNLHRNSTELVPLINEDLNTLSATSLLKKKNENILFTKATNLFKIGLNK